VQRLLTLPDGVALWPTHGAGSFCSAPPRAERTSSIGHERATNPLLRVGDEDTFVTALLASLGTYPTYFDRLGELNRRGPAPLRSGPLLAPVTPDEARQLLNRDAPSAVIVDVRPVEAFAAGHISGSLSIPLRDAFATWLGWVAPHDRPLLVVRDGRPGPRRGRVAGSEGRLRQHRRRADRRRHRRGSRRAADIEHPAGRARRRRGL
jgi:hypothetical protein